MNNEVYEYYKKYEPLFGNWYIKRIIGEGSFGRVFEIERHELGVTYRAALKIITVPQSQSEVKSILSDGMSIEEVTEYYKNIVLDIVKESELMSRLKGNTNIVSYEDHLIYEHSDGIGWDILIKMELLTPLLEHMSKTIITSAGVANLGMDICKALVLCESNQIIHRDIKPENIFVTDNGDYKLGDFGVARTLEKTSGGLSKKGTYTYMAPEIYKGEAYGANVDIYSLGIVMYWLLNKGRTPFLPSYPNPISLHDRENALIKRIGGMRIPRPLSGDDELVRIILKACEFNPQERYYSASEMLHDLKEVCEKRDSVTAFDTQQNIGKEYSITINSEENTAAVEVKDDETVSLDKNESSSLKHKKSIKKGKRFTVRKSLAFIKGHLNTEKKNAPLRLALVLIIAVLVLAAVYLMIRDKSNFPNLDKATANVYERVLVEQYYENTFKGPCNIYSQSDIGHSTMWRQTALNDITGDDSPELFFGRHIFTCEKGSAKDIAGEIYMSDSEYLSDGLCATTETEYEDITILGTIEYSSCNHDALYRLVYYVDNAYGVKVYKFEQDDNGELSRTMLLEQTQKDTSNEFMYLLNGKAIDRSEYYNAYNSTTKDFGDVINYSIKAHESVDNENFLNPLKQMNVQTVFESLPKNNTSAQEYHKMVDHLQSISKSKTPIPNETKEFINALVGIWGSTGYDNKCIEIEEDRIVYEYINEKGDGNNAWWDITGENEITIYGLYDEECLTLTWDKKNNILTEPHKKYTFSRYEDFPLYFQSIYAEESVIHMYYDSSEGGVYWGGGDIGNLADGDSIWYGVFIEKDAQLVFSACEPVKYPAIESISLCDSEKKEIETITFTSEQVEHYDDYGNVTDVATYYTTPNTKVKSGELYYIRIKTKHSVSNSATIQVWAYTN